MLNMHIRELSDDAFRRYGDVLWTNSVEGFQVLVEESDQVGWRLACLKLLRAPVKVLGRHPDSREAFYPLSGSVVILVAEENAPDLIQAFLLDKPVCIHKNIWHASYSLSETSCLGVAENASVSLIEHKLLNPVFASMSFNFAQ